ncbi:MAG: PAS domain S-box protein, partial [Syntrophothermus sp.]
FTPLHAERLQAFANQAALAIHNSRLMQQAQEEIEARKQVEARVKDLLEFNEKIINHSPLGILTYKMTGECVFVNKNAASILGGSVDKLLAQNFNDIEPWKTSGMYELVQRAISTRSALTADVHHITTFGKDIWLRAHFSIFKSKTQDHILLTISDITEQRLAEDRLRESENRLILALSAAQMSVWEWNVENNKVLLSPEFYPITGIPESAFDGTFEGYIGFVHPEDVVRVRESAKEAIEKNTIYSEEFRIVLPSGEVRWLSNLGHIEYGHSNTSMRMIGTVQEITRRKRVEMEQQALLEIMQGLAQAVDLQELVELVHRSIGNVIFAENFFVVFHNRDTGLFEEIYSVDQYDPPALPSKLEKSITSYVFRTCEPLLVDQALFDELAAQGEVELVGTDSASWLGAPLKTLNETIGVIVVQDYQNPRRYSERDKSFLSSIATQVALALERKQAEQKVRESEERYRALFENSPISIWEEDFTDVFAWMEELRAMGVKDLRKFLEENLDEYKVGVSLIRVLNVNETAVVMNGAQNKQELLNILHELLIDKTLSPVMVHEFDMIWQGHTSFDFEMSSPRTDGSLVTGILHVYIPRKNGRPDYSHVIVTSTDITERVEIEKKLRTSELHYRELSDSLTDVLVEIDRGLRFIHWNRATERLLGIPASAAIGKSLRELFGNAEELVRAERIYRSVFEESQPKTFETEFDVQGQKLFLEINANPSTRGVSIVARDITERKLLETLMQKRFELMDYSAHHSFDDVLQKTIDIVSDLTGSHIGFIHFVGEDQTTIKRLTWSTETIRRLRTAEGAGLHYPVENAGVWADAVRNRVPAIHNDPETSPYPAETPARPAKVIREMVIPILRNEKIVAVMGVGNKAVDYSRQDIEIAERFADYAWDITERKQMESALAEERNQLAKRVEERTSDLSRANSNLARALRVKDEFLANMSHELRTPLNAILGLSESLGEQVAGPLNEKQQKYLSTINESGHHLLSLINDILDLAKIEAGQIALDINRVDVNSVCQASLRMIKQLAQKKNLEVRFEIDPDLGLMWADERRLKQMIVNLLSNAVKFTPEYSRIGLEVRGDKAANKVIITVWDTGIGIREEDLERLFKPFVQLDSGLAREAQGTGLGLALVAQMARLHGGSVHAISRPGEGSRFIVQLPWEPAMASDMAARLRNTGKFRAIDPRAKRPTILLIEDTREVVMMLIDYLEMVGYRMVTAQDGIDGLAQAKLSHPDLILMDIQMPRLDGFETTQKLRSDPEFKETPIIALTALAMPNDRQRCLDAGMDEYISKPVNLRALTKTIQKFLTPET